jgi:hypothetical protein
MGPILRTRRQQPKAQLVLLDRDTKGNHSLEFSNLRAGLQSRLHFFGPRELLSNLAVFPKALVIEAS